VAFRDARAKPQRIRSKTRREGESWARACRAVPARPHATHARVNVGAGRSGLLLLVLGPPAESGAGARQGCYTGTVSVCADCGAIAMLRNYRRVHRKVFFDSPVIFYKKIFKIYLKIKNFFEYS
jgi:transposase InsO family protein